MLRIVCLLSLMITSYVHAAVPYEGMQLVWSDEFDGTSMDTSKWQHRYLGPRKGGVTSEKAISVKDGNLLITVSKENGKYLGGMISTEKTFQYKYGYIEFKAKPQTEYGFWSAGWLQSSNFGKNGLSVEDAGAEIDVFEALVKYGGDVLVGTHWDGYGSNHKKDQKLVDANIIDGNYHRFGLRWGPESYEFFLDDELIFTSTKAVSQTNEFIVLSAEIGSWAGNISTANLPSSVYFDYVRVYQKTGDIANQPEGIELEVVK